MLLGFTWNNMDITSKIQMIATIMCHTSIPVACHQCSMTPPMTYDIQDTRNPLIETFTKAAIDAVASFDTLETLEPAGTPSALSTELQL